MTKKMISNIDVHAINQMLTHLKQEEIKSAQRDTNLRAGTLQPDRTF